MNLELLAFVALCVTVGAGTGCHSLQYESIIS